MFKKTLLLSSVSALILAPGSAVAAEQMSMTDIQAQLQQLATQVENLSKVVEQQNTTIKQQEAALETQKKASAETAEVIANIQPAAGQSKGNVEGAKISFKPSPKIESLDGKYSFQPFGRAHFDVTNFDDDASDQDSNTNLRRARLGFKGKLGDDLSYKAEVDFAEEGVALRDMYVAYSGIDGAEIVLGNQKPKFGLQQNVSSNYLQVIERSGATNAFTRGHLLGGQVLTGGDNWSLAGGVFGEDAGNDDTGNDEDTSIDVRGSANLLGLVNEDTKNVLHIGAGYSHRRPTDSSNTRFRVRTSGDGPRAVDTGTIASVDRINIYGVELAGVYGPFSISGEYLNADVTRDNGLVDAEFDGYYAQAGWFVTGEQRPYSGKAGTFERVKPKSPFSLKNGGTGALELVARYENLDLNDTSAGILGGELKATTLGANWHLNNNVRLMANVIDVNTDQNAVVADDDPTIYNLRAQWDF